MYFGQPHRFWNHQICISLYQSCFCGRRVAAIHGDGLGIASVKVEWTAEEELLCPQEKLALIEERVELLHSTMDSDPNALTAVNELYIFAMALTRLVHGDKGMAIDRKCLPSADKGRRKGNGFQAISPPIIFSSSKYFIPKSMLTDSRVSSHDTKSYSISCWPANDRTSHH